MSESTEDTPQTPGPDVDDAPARRRRSPLAVASVAAAVLLAGGGGAYWAAVASGDGGSGGGSAQGGAPEPLALDQYPGVGKGESGTGASHGIAVGEHNPYGTRYKAGGKLPDGPKSAPAYLTGGKVTKEEVARLAKALDVSGTPHADRLVWKVGGTPDAMSPTLQVNQEGPGGWMYSMYGTPGGSTCVERPLGVGSPDDSVSSSDAEEGPAPKGCGSLRGGSGASGGSTAVSEQAAKRAAAPVLKTLGLSGAKLDAGEVHGALRVVTASPVIGGLPTHGWQTRLQIAADGSVVGGSGMLSELKPTGDYPLLSAEKTLKRLNDDAAGGVAPKKPTNCAVPVPHTDGSEPGADGKGKDSKTTDGTVGGGKGKDGSAECAPAPGRPATMTVEKATFGLAAHSVDGRYALVPSWIFEVRSPGASGDGATSFVAPPAIDPAFVKGTAADGGEEQAPGDEPAAPGEEPGQEAAPGTPVKPGKWDSTEHAVAYATHGRTLTLRFFGGVCSTYTGTAEESSGEVKVRITGERDEPGRPCITLAQEQETKVTLDKPLGDRKVVDASTGETVPVR